MKHIIITIFIGALSSPMLAQNFNFLTPTSLSDSGDAGDLFELQISFLPNDSSDITFKWQTLTNTFGFSWDYSLCDYNTCYISVPDSAKMGRLYQADFQNEIYGFFKLNVSTDAYPGEATLKLYVYDSANYTIGDTVSFHISTLTNDTTNNDTTNNDTSDATGILGIAEKSIQVFPNPTAGFVTIVANDIDEIQIVNALGQSVGTWKAFAHETTQLDLNELPNGHYFLRIQDSDGMLHIRPLLKG